MSFCYYVIKNTYNSDKQGLAPGVRIYKRKSNAELIYPNDDTLEGPYISLEEAKKNSLILENLLRENPQRYLKIIRETNFICDVEIIKVERGKTFPLDFVDSFEHVIKGKIKNKNVTGVHFYNSNRMRIIEEYGTDENGVCKAEIEIYDNNEDRWLRKKGITTLFPKSWSLQKLFDECCKASIARKIIQGTDYKYYYFTDCGIEMHLVIKDEKLISVYPVFKEVV